MLPISGVQRRLREAAARAGIKTSAPQDKAKKQHYLLCKIGQACHCDLEKTMPYGGHGHEMKVEEDEDIDITIEDVVDWRPSWSSVGSTEAVVGHVPACSSGEPMPIYDPVTNRVTEVKIVEVVKATPAPIVPPKLGAKVALHIIANQSYLPLDDIKIVKRDKKAKAILQAYRNECSSDEEEFLIPEKKPGEYEMKNFAKDVDNIPVQTELDAEIKTIPLTREDNHQQMVLIKEEKTDNEVLEPVMVQQPIVENIPVATPLVKKQNRRERLKAGVKMLLTNKPGWIAGAAERLSGGIEPRFTAEVEPPNVVEVEENFCSELKVTIFLDGLVVKGNFFHRATEGLIKLLSHIPGLRLDEVFKTNDATQDYTSPEVITVSNNKRNTLRTVFGKKGSGIGSVAKDESRHLLKKYDITMGVVVYEKLFNELCRDKNMITRRVLDGDGEVLESMAQAVYQSMKNYTGFDEWIKHPRTVAYTVVYYINQCDTNARVLKSLRKPKSDFCNVVTSPSLKTKAEQRS